jgi:hypothetical protein
MTRECRNCFFSATYLSSTNGLLCIGLCLYTTLTASRLMENLMWMAPPQSYPCRCGSAAFCDCSSLFLLSSSFSFFLLWFLLLVYCRLSLHTYLRRAPSPPSLFCAELSAYLKPSTSWIAPMIDLHHVSQSHTSCISRTLFYLAIARWILTRSLPSRSRHTA